MNTPSISKSDRLMSILTILLAILVCMLSIYLKLKDIDKFTDPDNFFTNHDAYRYARYAVEIQNNAYGRIDYLADVPDLAVNQYPPPLLSLIAVWMSNISGTKIQYFFLTLPLILSALFVIPLYLWLKPLNNPFVTLGAITMGLFNFQYFVRTRAGYFDTDCMILFFVFTILLFITKAGMEKDNLLKSYLYIVIAGLTMSIFRWWYDHMFFVLLFALSIFLSVLINKAFTRHVLCMPLFFIALSDPIGCIYYIFTSPFLSDYIYGTILDVKPYKMLVNVYAAVGELFPINFGQAVWFTTDNFYSFMTAVLFSFMLLIKEFRTFVVAIPVIAIGLLSFYSGSRYLIYLAPFIGMGFGYAISVCIRYLKMKVLKSDTLLMSLGLLITMFLLIPHQIVQFKTFPMYEVRRVNNLKKIALLTPADSYIWSWWGLGNPIQYYSQRATFMDNSHFSPHKVYSFISSLANEDEIQARNIIAFHTNNKAAIFSVEEYAKKIMGYQAAFNHPVYVMLYDSMPSRYVLKDNSLPRNEVERLTKRLPINSNRCNLKGSMTDCGGIVFDLNHRKIDIVDNKIRQDFKNITVVNKNDSSQQVYQLNPTAEDVIYIIIAKDGNLYKVTAHKEFEKTMFYKMLILSENSFRHFDLVYEDYPYMVLYKVR